MKRLLTYLLSGAVVASLTLLIPAPAQAATRCFDNGGQYPRCVTELRSERKLRAVETISFTNKTKRRQHYTCTFTTRISRAVNIGGSGTVELKKTIFKVVDASVSVTVHRSVTQTAEQATAAGFDGWVYPGETIYCDRMYGYVQSRVKVYQNYVQGDDYVDYRTIKTPIRLGVRVRQN